jgi:hypothetical protein
MKCWYLASNAQGPRLIITIVQVKKMKIYVTLMEIVRK